ncbi:MAG: ABC transporter substrate-binding protein [Microthrixaceae bacterium]
MSFRNGPRAGVRSGGIAVALALVAMLGVGRIVADATPGDGEAGTTLRLSVDGAPPTGPEAASTGDASAQAVAGLLWDGLTGPATRPGEEASPELARSWRSNDDFSRWTFTLDDSRTFSNGLLVEPHDVVASIRRSLTAGTGPVQRRLAQLLDGSPGLAITVDGARGVQFRLSETFVGLPLLLSAPEFGVTAAATSRVGGAVGGGQTMVTSGAYRVTGSTSTRWTLQRAPTGGGRPGPDTVVVTWRSQGPQSEEPPTQAAVDTTLKTSTVLSSGHRTTSDGRSAALTLGVHLNTRRPSFSSVEDRRDVLAALRADRLARSGFGADAVVSTALVPGDSGCGCRTAVPKSDSIDVTTPDDGLIILAQDTDSSTSMAQEVVDQLEGAGVPARARPLPVDEYTETLSEGSYDVVVAGVSAPGGSAPDAAEQLFASFGTLNYSGLADQRVDTLLTFATAAVGTEQAVDGWNRASEAIRDQAVVLPVVALSAADAAGPDGDGLEVRSDGSLDLSGLVREDG